MDIFTQDMRVLFNYFLNRTSIFDGCTIWRGFENKQHKTNRFGEIEVRLQIILTTPHWNCQMYVFS